MADSSRTNRIPNPNITWSLQHIHRNSHHLASSATQRIHDLHHYVVQGLTPLISTASLRPMADPYGNVIWQRERAADFHGSHGMESSSQDYVIDMGQEDGDVPEGTLPDSASRANNDSNYRSSEQQPQDQRNAEAQSEMDSLRNTPEFQMLLSFGEKYIPFCSILLMKLVFDHKLGIAVIIGLFATFFHSNRVVKREVAKQGKRNLWKLFIVSVNLMLCICIIYLVLAEEGLAYALVFVTPYTSPINVWDVLWVVSVTDFVIRMLTILLKICVVAIPARIIAFHKKGKHYLFIERTSQLYRTIAPMQHWLYFFSESYQGPSKVFGVILSAAYLIFKCKSILRKAKMCKNTFLKVLQSKMYGTTPSVSQVKEAGNCCPICQEDYKSPAMLQCKHIFCEDCVALWFDRERSCPICRAQIADDPAWRDGATSFALQIF